MARKTAPKAASSGNGKSTAAIMQRRFGEPEDPAVNHWIPSGITLLDMAVGYGVPGPNGELGYGFPGGKVIELFGEPSGGKTGVALALVKEAQKRGGEGIWFDAESALSVSFAQDVIGCRLGSGWAYTRENVLETVTDAVEELVEIHRESALPRVIVIDSVTALCPRALTTEEQGMTEGKRQQGLQAQKLSWWFSKGVLKKLAGSAILLVCVSQIRTKVGGMSTWGGPQEYAPGGWGIKHYASVRVHVSQESIEMTRSTGGVPQGAMIEAFVKKNRVAPDHRKVRFPLYHRPDGAILGFDDGMSQFSFLSARKQLGLSGSWWFFPDPEGNPVGPKFQKTEVGSRYRTDPEFAALLSDRARRAFCAEWGIPLPVPG